MVTTERVIDAKKKVSRRGLGSARGVERLKFTHELAQNNGLFLAHIENIELKTIHIGAETTGMPSFNDMDIPRLAITFASNEAEANKRHYITLSFTAVESNVENIPGGKSAWKVDRVFNWLKHILDVFILKGRDLTEDEEAALSLSFEDFDEQGDYVAVEPEEVVAGWTTFFENFLNIMNTANGGEVVYKDKNGKPLPLWIKLLRYEKRPNKGTKEMAWFAIDRGELTFPQYVGEGAIELYKQNSAPAIRVNAVKEDIRPRNIEPAKAPTQIGGAPMIGNAPVVGTDMNPFAGDMMSDSMSDMPF